MGTEGGRWKGGGKRYLSIRGCQSPARLIIGRRFSHELDTDTNIINNHNISLLNFDYLRLTSRNPQINWHMLRYASPHSPQGIKTSRFILLGMNYQQ